MLRTWNVLPTKLTTGARSIAAIALLFVVALIAGLRSPTGAVTVLAQELAGENTTVGGAAAFDTRYVSEDGGIVVAIRPARLLKNDAMTDVRNMFNETIVTGGSDGLGIHPADLDQVIISSRGGFASSYQTNFVVRATKIVDYSRLINNLTGKSIEDLPGKKYGDQTFYRVPETSGNFDEGFVEQRAFWFADDRTLVYDTIRHLRRYVDDDAQSQRLLKTEVWREMRDHDVAIIADQDSLQTLLKATEARPDDAIMSLLFMPLIDKTRLMGVSLQLDEDVHVSAVAVSRNEEDAADVKEGIDAARVVAKNMLQQMVRQAADTTGQPANTAARQFSRDPLIQAMVKTANNVLTQTKVLQQAKATRVEMSADTDDLQLTVLAPAIAAARAAAKRTQSMNNLKQIALAFHIYHDVHKHFPGAAAVPQGNKHPVSWRVAILPYIDQQELFDQYNMDEPWDSEHNRKLLAKIPSVYRHADMPANSTSPSYFVLTGPDTIFRDDAPRIRDIIDGTSHTILAVEAQRDIPWTKPEDIPFDKEKPVPKFGGFAPQGYNAAFSDGAVKFISNKIDKNLVHRLIMSQDGQPAY